MKKFYYLSILFISALTLSSCSESDDDASEETSFNYFPLAINNEWNTVVTTGTDTSDETLTVSSNSGSSFNLTTNNSDPDGIMTGVLTQGTLNQNNNNLQVNGTLDFRLQGLQNLTVNLIDAPLYNQNAGDGSQLYTVSGSGTETLDGLDLNINYTVRTIQREDIASMTVPAGTFSNVIHSQLIIQATISSDVLVNGAVSTVDVLTTQDVFTVDNYWAQDVGLIKSENQFSYMLQDFSSFGVDIPLPISADILSVQELESFTIN